ncbi:MAG TPA: hypothetical protein VGL94_13945 [Ktedonobacteraceae bacterium]|jgi:hypothetical protein
MSVTDKKTARDLSSNILSSHAVLLPAQPLSAVLDAAQSYSVSYMLLTPNQGKEEQQIWKRTLTNSRLKLLWSSPSGKLYRFHDPSKHQ